MPLQQLCLTMRANLAPSTNVPEALARLLTPPPAPAVAAAMHSLTAMGALEDGGGLTMLGQHLARMPMEPQLGKALVYGALLRFDSFTCSTVTSAPEAQSCSARSCKNIRPTLKVFPIPNPLGNKLYTPICRCLSPVLTIVAAMAYGRPVFVAPLDKRDEARAAKLSLASAAPAAAKSDHIASIAAFNAWHEARQAGGRHDAAQVITLHLSHKMIISICMHYHNFINMKGGIIYPAPFQRPAA